MLAFGTVLFCIETAPKAGLEINLQLVEDARGEGVRIGSSNFRGKNVIIRELGQGQLCKGLTPN